jgi:hypothetical protein
MGHGSWALQNTQRRYLPIAEMCAPKQGNFKKIRRSKRLLNDVMLRMDLALLDCPPVPHGPLGRT